MIIRKINNYFKNFLKIIRKSSWDNDNSIIGCSILNEIYIIVTDVSVSVIQYIFQKDLSKK